MAAPLTAAERLQLLARSWTTVAQGYRSNFVHRFAPWTQDTLRAFVQAGAGLPEGGAIAVPACGPGGLKCWACLLTGISRLHESHSG